MKESKISVFTNHKIIKGKEPILYVLHDQDGDWQFLSGGNLDIDNAAMVSLKQIANIDSSVKSLFDMPVGYSAKRNNTKEKWIMTQL